MRPVICALLTLVASTCTAFATANVTIVLQFEARHSDSSVREMKRELQSLMQDSGVELSWRRADELSASDSFPSIVVVTFHGSCEMKTLPPPLPTEPIALGYARVSNGAIIPFADVECDRVRSSLRSANAGLGPRGDLLLGRALGRILAHELHHIIDQTRVHSRHGILSKSLTPIDLVADQASMTSTR
jgi:hypothetical protein